MDFDGTLADTAHILQKIYNETAHKKGWPTMSTNDYKRLRKGSLREALTWAGVHPWQLPLLLYQGRRRFLSEIDEVEIFTGMEKLARELKNSGWDVYVLSMNSNKAVSRVLAKNNLSNTVHVLPRASIIGKHYNLKRFLRRYKYPKQNVWMIGDEVRDIEAAKRAGVKILSTTWGLQDESVLKQAGPDGISRTPDDIRAKLC